MNQNNNSADLDQLFCLLQSAVRGAGATAMSYFRNEFKIEEKSDGSKVSEADHAVNDHLRECLTGAAPDFAWLSEESPITQDRLENPFIWIVDPIDGTNSFIRGSREWTIVASLVHDHQPVLSVVFNPATNQFYCAQKNKGATLNGKPISASNNESLSDAHIISSKGHFRRSFLEGPGVRSNAPPARRTYVNSMAYRIVLVADGSIDGTISLTPKNDWDIAAPSLILTEAGGKFGQPDGRPISYNKENLRHPGIVAASSALYKKIIENTKHAINETR